MQQLQFLEITTMGSQQHINQRLPQFWKDLLQRISCEDTTSKRIAIGMQAVGGETEQHISWRNACAILPTLCQVYSSYYRSSQIKGPGVIDARHLGRLPT